LLASSFGDKMAELFGFEIKRKSAETVEPQLNTFSPQIEEDGALVVAAGGVYGTVLDLEGSIKTEAELVTKYREMSLHPEIDSAIDDVVNEAIITDEDFVVKINLDRIDEKTLPVNVREIIEQEFDGVLQLLDFNSQCYEIFRRWYIDGRLYYHAVIDTKEYRAGIQEMRYIDPRKIKKVKEQKKKKSNIPNAPATVTTNEYYVYNEKGFATVSAASGASSSTPQSALKISKDSIVHVTSGLVDKNNTTVLSYLHKAIKPLNQLRALEDATVIYRISRAPERRIFYIDVGNLPKMKAEQYLRDMMTRHKNKVVYDASSGEIRDDRKFMTMLEDFWLPRREGSRGTEIETLPGGQNLGEMADVEYFQKSLYKSLNVPISRLQSDSGFSLGRASEISRDEIKFQKFVSRLRIKFNQLLLKTLETQLVLKGVITKDDWKFLSSNIDFIYARDNFFSELKDLEITKERFNAFSMMEGSGVIGKYFSNQWVRLNVFKQTRDDMEEMDREIVEERSNEIYYPPVPDEQGLEQSGQQPT
jgi:Bacteriophage T4-like portal protein (Gp20)